MQNFSAQTGVPTKHANAQVSAIAERFTTPRTAMLYPFAPPIAAIALMTMVVVACLIRLLGRG